MTLRVRRQHKALNVHGRVTDKVSRNAERNKEYEGDAKTNKDEDLNKNEDMIDSMLEALSLNAGGSASEENFRDSSNVLSYPSKKLRGLSTNGAGELHNVKIKVSANPEKVFIQGIKMPTNPKKDDDNVNQILKILRPMFATP